MSEITSIDASELIKENYLTYGSYINGNRSTSQIDGLKSVYRRMLLSVRDQASSKFIRSSAVVGHCLGAYHPHGESSAYDVLCNLVKYGYVHGSGNLGGYFPEDRAAAMRYTSVKAREKFNEAIFRLVPYIPQKESEFGIMEPIRLPTPIPLCISTGLRGIGIGLLNSVPAFSPTSVFKALHSDDPELLKAPDNITIVLSDSKRLWERGDGMITYGLNVFQTNIEGRTSSVIEGSPRVFVPAIERVLSDYLEDETVVLSDMSRNHIRYIASRVKGVKRVTDEMIHERVRQAALRNVYVNLFVSEDGETAKRFSLQNWLVKCWELYGKAVDDYKSDAVKRLQRRIQIYNLIPKVYPLIVQNKTTKQIAAHLEESEDLIRDIEGRPLRLLRKSDFNKEVKKLKDDIRGYDKINAMSLGQEFVEDLEEAQTIKP